MSCAFQNFEIGIKDAQDLLDHFDAVNSKPPNPNAEVLKRAALVMALTAWETYVEDRLSDEMHKKLDIVAGSYVGDFVLKRLQHDLKQFHNPSAEKTKRIFQDYLGFDVTIGWTWPNYECDKAKKTLDHWIAKRGAAVHRSRSPSNGLPSPHLVKREELEKVIRFFKDLARATDEFVTENIR